MELNLTLKQLQSVTKAQILDGINTRLTAMTKAQLIGLILTVADDVGLNLVLSDAPVIVNRPDGQIASRATIRRNTLGIRVGRETTDWTYYPTGEVDVITTTRFDSNDAVAQRRAIQHYTDGSQPTVTEG